MIELLNCDCMEYMATVPDKYFDLAVVDVPYGIGENGDKAKSRNRFKKALINPLVTKKILILIKNRK